jgi:hypothetical protein
LPGALAHRRFSLASGIPCGKHRRAFFMIADR